MASLGSLTRLTALFIAAAATACATPPGRRASEEASTASRTASETARTGLPDAASQPLSDLNLRRKPIPAPLAAIDYVYEAAPTPDCAAITAETRQLTAVLGKDYDAEAEERSVGEKSGEAAGDFVIDTVRGVSTGWIPYRGLVRQASGAARYDAKTARAFTNGHARRAYLRGLAVGLGCPPPAAPSRLTPPPEEPAVERRVVPDRDPQRWGAPVEVYRPSGSGSSGGS